MARSSSSSSSSSSGSPAAKRTAIAPKTQRASTSAAAAAAAAAASSSSKHNAVALASLADALPDQTANLPIAVSSSSSNEPSLGDRINQSHANGKRLLNNNLQRKQQQQQRPLINGSASHPHDDDQDDEDAHHALAPSFSSKFPNGKLNGSTTRSTGAAGDPDLLTLLQQEGSNEAQHDNNDDLSPFPLPSSNPLSSSPALSHALTQALHSADTALLSSILSHSDPLLIRSTVQRLSGARALSLLEHCVSRLVANPTADARARGTATGKVRTNVEWIRAILVIHTSYLMALPHLTTKLASLHMALSSRLASHQRLLALQGRLDLVLSQIEMRSAYAAAAGVSEEKAGKRRKGTAIQGVSSKLAGANAAAAAAVAGQKKGSKRQFGEDDPTRWVEPSDDEDDEQNDENLQPTPNNTMDVDVDPSSDDDEEEDSDEDDNDEDDEEEEEQYEELSPVDPASELEDDSDIEDIMLGPGFSSSASPRANGTAKSRRRRILEDSEDGGDTTADSGPDDDDDGDGDDDDLQYGGLASAMRARGMAQRLAEAAKQTSALNTGGASASGSVKGPGSEDLVAVKSRRGKRGAGAVAEQAPAKNGKATASGAKASKMDLDDDDDDEEDDESLLDEEGNSDLEDDDEEDDDDHADCGMADMEAESTDGDGEEDDDEEEEED